VTAGLLLALLWYLVLRRAKYYVSRWEHVVDRLEREADASDTLPSKPLLRYFWDAQAQEPSAPPFLRAETSQLMKVATILTGVLWIVTAIGIAASDADRSRLLRCADASPQQREALRDRPQERVIVCESSPG
jgi:hypothetical protein